MIKEKYNIFLLSDINLDLLYLGLKKNKKFLNNVYKNELNDFNLYLFSENILNQDFHNSEILFIWPSIYSVSLEFKKILDYKQFDPKLIESEIINYTKSVKRLALKKEVLLIPLITFFNVFSDLGIGNMSNRFGKQFFLNKINSIIMEELGDISNIYLIDPNEVFLNAQKKLDNKLWLKAKIPISIESCDLFSKFIVNALKTIFLPCKKMLVLDLDNTIWGGILGDDGWNDIKIGGHDYIGEAFLQFQIEIKKLANRGILLAICSKNNLEFVEEAFHKNSYLHLQLSDFCIIKANWENKADNILKIAKEANILLNSIVFIDDSLHERELVKKLLPDVFVPDFPKDISQLAIWINKLNCFNTISLTKEDKTRNKSLKANLEYKNSQITHDKWLKDLDIKIQISELSSTDVARCLQLINKTNQMNVFTNRYSEKQFNEIISQDQNTYFKVIVQDKLFPAEVMGVIGIEEESKSISLKEFILSCRAFGKNIEHTMFEALKIYSKYHNKDIKPTSVIPNNKNKVCQTFFKNLSYSNSANYIILDDEKIFFKTFHTKLEFKFK